MVFHLLLQKGSLLNSNPCSLCVESDYSRYLPTDPKTLPQRSFYKLAATTDESTYRTPKPPISLPLKGCRHSSVDSSVPYHPADPGLSPKYTIYAFIIYCHICHVKWMKINEKGTRFVLLQSLPWNELTWSFITGSGWFKSFQLFDFRSNISMWDNFEDVYCGEDSWLLPPTMAAVSSPFETFKCEIKHLL